ncbi:MAG: glycosyltransferase family 2 protein [Microbacterium sp.]
MTVGWRDTWPGVLRKTAVRWSQPKHWRDRGKVLRGLDLPTLRRQPGSIWGIAMVKNEADVLARTIEHLFAQGVDRMLVVDNGSDDHTPELLQELAHRHPIDIGTDAEVGYFQSHKMSALAEHARRAGADWVIPFDADEFWFAPDATVADFLRTSTGTRVEAELFNVFPTRAHPVLDGLGGEVRFDMRPHLLRKVAAQTHPLLWIGMGNHLALRPGDSSGGLRVVHLPWRSEEQLMRKLRQGAAAYRTTGIDTLGGHWKSLGEADDERLHALWQGLLDGRTDPALGWHPVGPFTEIDLSSWQSWDPERLIADGLDPQRPTF